MKKTLILLAALLAFAACKPVEVEVIKEVEVEKIVDILSLNAAQLRVPNSAVEQPLSFTTTDAWTISSDVDWITFDKTSGNSGSSNVTMKVAANSAYDTRTGRVTLSTSRDGTAKNTVFTVVQSETEVFNTTVECRVDYTEQDIAVDFNSNLTPEVAIVEGAEWLTITQTKAAPVDGKIVVHVALNEELDSRVGSFTVAAGSSIQTYNVMQASQYAAASSATALFLGNKQDMYDSENWVFRQFAQYAVQFATAEGDVTLVLNVDPEAESFTKIPAGEYKMDESATYAPGTYSIVIPEGKYVTNVVSGGKAMEVIDGTITVEDKGSSTAIVAELVDVAGTSHLYSYTGELVAEDASLGASVYTADGYSGLKGTYNTYYTTKAYETSLFLHINKALAEGQDWVYGVGFNIYTESSDGSIPTGKFNYAVPETKADLGYANGVTDAAVGTFDVSGINAIAQDPNHYTSCEIKEGTTPTLEITKQDDGNYTVAFSATVVISEYYYDESNNQVDVGSKEVELNATIKDVYCSEIPDSGFVPHPDGEFNFTKLGTSSYYMPFWFGDAYDTGCQVMRFGWNYVDQDYSVQIALNVKDDDWKFEKNFNNRYCNTPFKLGTFNFSWTPGENTMLPIKTYHHVINKYTGHTYTIIGGSVTMDSGSISYDLTVAYGDQTFHIGGGHPAALYYIRDYSSSAAPGLDTAE